jgi:hypothetical protein
MGLIWLRQGVKINALYDPQGTINVPCVFTPDAGHQYRLPDLDNAA